MNDRGDGYGGSPENRVRLPLEAFQRVREVVGEDFAVGCRYLAEDCVEGGNTVDDAAWFGTAFARAGFDFLSLSRGGRFEDAKQPSVGAAAYPYTGPSGYECSAIRIRRPGPFGRNANPPPRSAPPSGRPGTPRRWSLPGAYTGFEQAALLGEKADG